MDIWGGRSLRIDLSLSSSSGSFTVSSFFQNGITRFHIVCCSLVKTLEEMVSKLWANISFRTALSSIWYNTVTCWDSSCVIPSFISFWGIPHFGKGNSSSSEKSLLLLSSFLMSFLCSVSSMKYLILMSPKLLIPLIMSRLVTCIISCRNSKVLSIGVTPAQSFLMDKFAVY